MNNEDKNSKKFLIKNIFLEPIIPVVFFIYCISFNICDIKIVSVFLTIFISGIFCKFIFYIKVHYRFIFQVGVVCIDWFLIDIVNFISNNSFYFLKPSLLETIAKNSLAFVV